MGTSPPPVGNARAKTFITAAGSGVFTGALLQPFDVIKTVQQATATTSGQPRLGFFHAAKDIYADAGPRGFYRGLGPTLVRLFGGVGVYFTTLQIVIDALNDPVVHRGAGHATIPSASHNSTSTNWGSSGPSALSKNFVAGAIARSIAAALLCPVSVVKTRFEWAKKGTNPYNSTFHAVAQIGRQEGVRGLYRGLVPTIVRDAPYSGLYFMAYEKLKISLSSKLDVPRFALNISAGFVGSVLATLATHPADVIKTRLQLAARVAAAPPVVGNSTVAGISPIVSPTRATAVAIALIRDEGLPALFRGLSVRLLKRGVSTALTWALFEEMRAR